MKVVLTTSIDKLGAGGDTIYVADGFARNYLLPKGIAVLPGDNIVKELRAQKIEKAQLKKSDQSKPAKKSYRQKRLEKQQKQDQKAKKI